MNQAFRTHKTWIIGSMLTVLALSLGLVLSSQSGLNSLDVVLAQGAKTWLYSVKYVCAKNLVGSSFISRGNHFTAINIQNFSESQVSFTMKRVVPESQVKQASMISQKIAVSLGAMEALDLNCVDILETDRFGEPAQDVVRLGFVIIESPIELEVVGVYSSEIIVEERASDFPWPGAWQKILYAIISPDVPGAIPPGGGRGNGGGDDSDGSTQTTESKSAADDKQDAEDEGAADGDLMVELWDKIIFVIQGSSSTTVVEGTLGSSGAALPGIGELGELIVKSKPGFGNPKQVVQKALEQEMGGSLGDGLDIKIISVEFGVGAAKGGGGLAAPGSSDPCQNATSEWIFGLGGAGIIKNLDDAIRKQEDSDRKAQGDPPLDADAQIVICDVEFAIGMDPAVFALSIAVATAIDIEYIQPHIIER